MEQAIYGRTNGRALFFDGFRTVIDMPSFRSGAIELPNACEHLLFVGAKAEAPDCEHVDGVRLVAAVPISDAVARIRDMVQVDIIWLAAVETVEPDMLAILCAVAAEKQCHLICETSLAALDRVAEVIPDVIRVEWLVDADGTDRRMALAAARQTRRQVVHDGPRDEAMERIDRLQEEVARIARLLGDLAGQHGGLPGTPGGFTPRAEDFVDYPAHVRAPLREYSATPRSFVPEERTLERQRAKAVRRMLRQRRLREQYFPADLFADPAWDMLLDLYAARLERQPVSVSSLCIAAAVPATTALRWIKTMTDAGLFVREADPLDGRRIFIGLAEAAFEPLARYFEALEE